MYTVEISQFFNARQGLKSPVREGDGLPPLVDSSGFKVIMRVGISFADDHLTSRGWFVDTDAAEKQVAECVNYLASQPWTQLFDFRPTFELVAKWAYEKLSNDITQLRYVELENATISVNTRYQAQQ